MLDKVADTLALGDADAARLLAEARDPDAAAPTDVPAVLKDAKKPAFFRANLALAYGKALSNRKVYEEALDALRAAKAEDVVDPATVLLPQGRRRARPDAEEGRRRHHRPAARRRRRRAGALPDGGGADALRHADLAGQGPRLGRPQDGHHPATGSTSTRGGKKTQKMQKEVVVRLDEMIKEMENQQKGNGC